MVSPQPSLPNPRYTTCPCVRAVSTSASVPPPPIHSHYLVGQYPHFFNPRGRRTGDSPPHSFIPPSFSQARRSRMAGGMPSAWSPSPALVTALVALLGLGLAVYIVGPPLYWHAAEALAAAGACPACDCDCDARPLFDLPEDCAKQFKGVKSRASGEETEKSFTELLIEELRQREEEATQAQQQADVKLLEAKKLASQYQKEADKCSSGMDTCEEAREKSAEALIQQKKLTAMWEQRARERGWKPGNMKSQRR